MGIPLNHLGQVLFTAAASTQGSDLSVPERTLMRSPHFPDHTGKFGRLGQRACAHPGDRVIGWYPTAALPVRIPPRIAGEVDGTPILKSRIDLVNNCRSYLPRY